MSVYVEQNPERGAESRRTVEDRRVENNETGYRVGCEKDRGIDLRSRCSCDFRKYPRYTQSD